MASNKAKLILVTGATGQQGGAALKHLHSKGFAVRALTRDPNKPVAHALVGHGTEVVRGDLNDPDSLRRAMDGVHGVYSVQTSAEEGPEAEVRQGIHVADAAQRARISHLVYSSVWAADQKTGVPHFESKFRIEEHIRGTGVPYTIFRPVFFMENWTRMRDQIEQGRIALPLSPDTRLQMIAVDDIGAFIAMAFERAGRWRGRAMELAGDELSMSEVAQAYSRIEGREVRYEQVPWDQFERNAGPAITRMYKLFQDNPYRVDIAAVRQENHNLTNFDRWLQSKPQVLRGTAR